MNEQNYTSLKLSKKLAEAGCELESEYAWDEKRNRMFKTSELIGDADCMSFYPAYDILNDLCVHYGNKFFGDKIGHYSELVLEHLRYGDKEMAEDLIWNVCEFNENNIFKRDD